MAQCRAVVKTESHQLLQQAMAQSCNCWGHKERENRANKILKLATKSKETPDENCRVWIKKGPVSVETSLKEIEDSYESKPGWKVVEDGGIWPSIVNCRYLQEYWEGEGREWWR